METNADSLKMLNKVTDFVGFDQSNYRHFPRIARILSRLAPKALKRLYARIEATPAVSGMFASKDAMRHAQSKQLEHWQELFARPLDAAYVARAEKIGTIHARIGLEPSWYVGAYATILEEVISKLVGKSYWPLVMPGTGAMVGTMVKAALLDMQIALSTYFRIEDERRAAVIQTVSEALDALAKGDLTREIEGLPAEYAADYTAMRMQLHKALTTVSSIASSVDSGTLEISQAAADLASRTEKQAATLEETAAAVQEITESIRQTANNAQQVSSSVATAHRDAAMGETIVSKAINSMSDIETSSREIAQIVNVIDGIAFQTNLLALNAGVEAARAGESGRGFAVVASEVRALAQRAADSATSIKELIKTSSEHVERGVGLVGQTGEILQQIVTKVGETARVAEDISRAASTQASGAVQINTAVAGMDTMTQQNAAMVEETSAAARMLAQQASDLVAAVNQFQLTKSGSGRGSSAYSADAETPQRFAA
jgi:methyl-accepting chemotaxis protein